jgi:hypothetical protein
MPYSLVYIKHFVGDWPASLASRANAEGSHLARNRGIYDDTALAGLSQCAIPPAEARLCLPGDVGDDLWQFVDDI